MATASDSNIEKLFRILLHQIGIKLTSHNCHSLKFLNNLDSDLATTDTSGVPALDILQYLQTKGDISPLQPEHLENNLLRIERGDLASLVKQYRKSDDYKEAKKSENKHAKSKGQAAAGHGPQQEKCASVISLSLMHVAQSVGQTSYFLETVVGQMEDEKPHELTAIMSDIKKDFEHLGKSLKKAIAVTTKRDTTESRPIYSTVYKKPAAAENQKTFIQKMPSCETHQNQPKADNLYNLTDPVATQERLENSEGHLEELPYPESTVNNGPPGDPGYSLLSNRQPVFPPRQQRVLYKPLLPPRKTKEELKSITLPHTYANLAPKPKLVNQQCTCMSNVHILHIRVCVTIEFQLHFKNIQV